MKEKMKMSSIKNIILISKNIQKMKSDTIRALPRSLCHSASEDSCLSSYASRCPQFLSHPYFKMLGCRSRVDVATLPRRDVETSRRGSHLHALFFIAPKTASTIALFAPLYLYSTQTPNHESSHKNCINNIK